MGDGRRPPRTPLGLGTAAGTHRASRAPPTRSGRERGDRELSLRLARGEITADEFEQRRRLVLDAFRP
ncbi:SHOCT domain-containing protein [Brachybacterium sp. GU-2]|uniref:SHOCT domain-containing protein n=1 Tax=Brachybacterium sp. GU-2 TaxID=3069708 RepID=UPI00298CC456|nr:SHOCT domain-containing protein [Brachybacterium sp. GU-2]WME24276.2 SHOCT domain-containing protein [Brachybacterium sp. GU-2]